MPALGSFAGLGLGRDQLEAVEVADAAAEDEVAGREDIGAAEVEEEEELGAPAAEAAHGGDRRDHFVVVEASQGAEVESPVFDPRRQVAHVFDLAAREPDLAQVGVARRQHDGRRQRRPRPPARRSGRRSLRPRWSRVAGRRSSGAGRRTGRPRSPARGAGTGRRSRPCRSARPGRPSPDRSPPALAAASRVRSLIGTSNSRTPKGPAARARRTAGERDESCWRQPNPRVARPPGKVPRRQNNTKLTHIVKLSRECLVFVGGGDLRDVAPLGRAPAGSVGG